MGSGKSHKCVLCRHTPPGFANTVSLQLFSQVFLEVLEQTVISMLYSPSGKPHAPLLLHTQWPLHGSLAHGDGSRACPLTSALLLRVTPVPILTPGACAAPKSCPAGTLTRDLREKHADPSAGTKRLLWETEKIRGLRGSTCSPSTPSSPLSPAPATGTSTPALGCFLLPLA